MHEVLLAAAGFMGLAVVGIVVMVMVSVARRPRRSTGRRVPVAPPDDTLAPGSWRAWYAGHGARGPVVVAQAVEDGPAEPRPSIGWPEVFPEPVHAQLFGRTGQGPAAYRRSLHAITGGDTR